MCSRRGRKNEACAMAHACRHDTSLRRRCLSPLNLPVLLWFHGSMRCCQRDHAGTWSYGRVFTLFQHLAIGAEPCPLRCAHASQSQPLWHSTQTTTNRDNHEGLRTLLARLHHACMRAPLHTLHFFFLFWCAMLILPRRNCCT